jgi:hypothetical protein
MERHGQVQALDLLTDFPTNWYLPPTNVMSQNQGWTVDLRQLPIPPQVMQVASNGTTMNVNTDVVQGFGPTQLVLQLPALPQ